jgi:gliding motility-associated-like protein
VKKNLFFLFFFHALSSFSQVVWMTPNRGQWDERILYNVDLNGGKLYIENKGMTFYLTTAMDHDHQEQAEDHEEERTKYHALKHVFPAANENYKIEEVDSSAHYSNYILGSDKAKWKSLIRSFSLLKFKNYFDGIHLIYDGKKEQLSFHFDAEPGADLRQLNFILEGAESLFIDERGNLVIKHSLGTISYSKPKAWTINENENQTEVEVEFLVQGNEVSFSFPEGYDKNQRLFIDPSLTFSTFSGSTTDNWGFTATPDVNGNLFGGGIVFGSGYPTTTGAFDASYNSGSGSFPMDVGITKFNAAGTALLYSTYIGGTGNETPHSIVCAPNGELYIYGVTSSANFPMAGSSFDASFNGGPYELQNSLEFNGSDIYIARLNSAGSSLISSTYIGGTNTDGLNPGTLHYNYGDQFRGEIVLDGNQNVYVSSTTQSSNFPIVNGAQTNLNGIQDAVILKLNSNLSSILWSSYFGGSGLETGNSITIGTNGSVYVAGGTSSNSIPVNSGNDLSFNGGLSDGYALRINSGNGSFQSGTYMGQAEYDQSYFIRVDVDNFPYVFGQTESAWTISPGCYGIANSGQYLRKYNADLSTISWTTMIGASSGHVEISPTAFLISNCYDIYLAGWGGVLNQVGQATFSSTNGFQTTPDAYQGATNGSNFYIAVLDQDASSLKYATFMGGMSSSSNHVDGGTSRFDNSGRIYHAVCGACGGNDFGFTSTPGSWSPQNSSPNCNLAVFKFELSAIEAAAAQPAPLICIPQSVYFINNSTNGNSYFWDFGDGTSSILEEPIHQYTTPGVYDVELLVFDSTGCFSPDSVTVTVNIGSFTAGVVQPPTSICPGDSYQLNAYGGATYLWSPANVLNNVTIANPIATIFSTTTFNVTISDSCGTITTQVTLDVSAPNVSINNDTTICFGESVDLIANGSGAITWVPSTFLTNVNTFTTTATPNSNITYIANVVSANGCTDSDTMSIQVFFDSPSPVLDDTTLICNGGSSSVNISGGTSYFWYPTNNLIGQNNTNVILSPPTEQYYYCDVTNSCGTTTDSIWVEIIIPQILAGNDTIVCPNYPAAVNASGAASYVWSPSPISSNADGSQAIVQNQTTTNYMVIGTDIFGCKDTAYVLISTFPQPFVFAGSDVYALIGEPINLAATSSGQGTFLWTPSAEFTCATCQNTSVNTSQNSIYTIYFTDLNGCKATSQVSIYFDPFFYVPNTFTPDGDQFNNGFSAIGGNFKDFEMTIFNRWGELIYTMKSLTDYWDGTYNNVYCEDGTYVWKIVYSDFAYRKKEITGHVNLLR